MKDFLKKLFGKSEEVEQPEMDAPAEEASSTDEQSEEKMM